MNTRLPTAQRWGIYLALTLLSIPALLPLMWMVSTSFKSNAQIFASSGFIVQGAAPHSTREHATTPDALHNMPFLLYLRNTIAAVYLHDRSGR